MALCVDLQRSVCCSRAASGGNDVIMSKKLKTTHNLDDDCRLFLFHSDYYLMPAHIRSGIGLPGVAVFVNCTVNKVLL